MDEPRDRLDLVIGGADRGRHEDVVVPDDRRAPAQTGDLDLPGDILGLAPGVGQGAGSSATLPAFTPRNFGHCCAAPSVATDSSSVRRTVTVVACFIARLTLATVESSEQVTPSSCA